MGALRTFNGRVYITIKGTAAGALRVPIPSGAGQSLSGGNWVGSGYSSTNKSCNVSLYPSNSYIEIYLYDGATAITSDGLTISFSISYEIT